MKGCKQWKLVPKFPVLNSTSEYNPPGADIIFVLCSISGRKTAAHFRHITSMIADMISQHINDLRHDFILRALCAGSWS